MTKVMVKTWFGSYVGQSIQLYYAGRRTIPMLIVKRPDGSHRTERVVDVIDLGPDPAPTPTQPQMQPQFTAPPVDPTKFERSE